MLRFAVERMRDHVTVTVAGLCLAAVGLLATPKPASAFEGDRSCACSNLEACPYQFQRFCCEWNGGTPQCGCSFYVTNCVEDQ